MSAPMVKAGLELHQQLDTGGKLFCRCPPSLRPTGEASVEFTRVLRPARSEVGEVDVAAAEEYRRARTFRYLGYDTTCLVEYDEEPPRELNREALETALQIGLLLGMEPVEEVHVMRKIVIDGSNTCGFQRTALIATGGSVETPSGPIGIATLCLEEDAAQRAGEEGETVTYSLDRLGIPLVELATEPQISSPAQAREVAETLGMVFRSTGRVKRGLGTVRQDVNVSTPGGARVEIKGVQELTLVEKVVGGEVERQRALLKMAGGLRGGGERVAVEDATVNLRGFAPHRALLAPDFLALAGRYRATLQMEAKGEDLHLRLGGPLAPRAAGAIASRARLLLERVPEETRRALEDGSTEYMRPLPGAARMYPETDVPPVEVGREWLERLRSHLPELSSHRRARYQKEYGLNEELAGLMASGDHALFERILAEAPGLRSDATLVVRTLTATLPGLARGKESIPPEKVEALRLDEKRLLNVFRLVEARRVAREALEPLLRQMALQPGAPVESLAGGGASEEEARRLVEQVVSSRRDMVKAQGERAFQPLMGLAMKELRGKVDGATISRILREAISREMEKSP